MKMKAFCTATGLSRDTVNFYIGLGLLRPSSSCTSGNNYRDFNASDVETARMIVLAKGLGFTLAEIADLAKQYSDAQLHPAKQISLLREKLDQLAERRKALDDLENALLNKLNTLQADYVEGHRQTSA